MRAPEGFVAVVLLSVLAFLVALVFLASPSLGADLYWDSDRVIDTDEEYSGDNIIANGHVNIKDGGSLTLRNCTFKMDSQRGDQLRITVEDTGNLYAYDTEITNRNAGNNDERFFFDCWNDTVLVNCDISRLYGWNNDNQGGLRLFRGSHLIVGCTIHDSRTWGIRTYTNLILRRTTIYSTGWSQLYISTDGRLVDLDFYVQNCTFIGNVNDPGNYGVNANDGYSGQFGRYLNISHCNFEGLGYGCYINPSWQRGVVEMSHNDYDRNTYGIRAWTNALEIFSHHNHYSVRSGGIGMRIYQGSYGNITYRHEDIRGSSLGAGTGLYLEGAGTGRHYVKDVSIWNTYSGIISLFGPCEVRDCYINVTNNTFHVYNRATIDVWNTEHKVGTGFVDTTGGRITVWQRLDVASVRWSDGTEITTGLVHLLNSTDYRIGYLNLSRGESFLDFKRWECRRSYLWVNVEVYPALLDVDTWFRAEPLDILKTGPQIITFTDDYTPRLTVRDLADGAGVNVSYLILEGSVVERGRGLIRVEASLDGVTWSTASVTGEAWEFVFSLLADGRYDLHLRATDRAGNVGTLDVMDIVVDTGVPMIYLLEDPPKATDDPTLRLEGTTEAGATLYLGHLVVDADENGAFAIEYPLSEGTNGLVLRVRDAADNWNQLVMSVVLDTTAPPLSLLTPKDGLVTKEVLVYVSGKTEEGVNVSVNGETVGTYRGGFSHDLTLPEGTHDVEVLATDPAGNTASVTVTVTVDITPPTLVIERPAEPEFTTVDDSAFIAGSMDADLSYIFINGQNRSALPGEFAIQVDLVEGENVFTITAIDLAGNEARKVVKIVRDTRPPNYTVEQVSVTNGDIVQSGSDRFTTGDGLVFTVRVDEDAVFSIGPKRHEGTGQFTIDHTLQQGTNTITINVEDVVGNQASPYIFTIILDDEPPMLVITSPAGGYVTHLAQVTITGTTEDGRSLVWINDVPAGVRSDGGFELTMPLEWGENTFTVRSKDRAGNEASKSIAIDRREKEEVTESNVGPMALALVIGLVVGIAVMYAASAKGRGGGGTSDEHKRSPPRPPERTPPPPPPGGPDGGPPGEGPNWEEY